MGEDCITLFVSLEPDRDNDSPNIKGDGATVLLPLLRLSLLFTFSFESAAAEAAAAEAAAADAPKKNGVPINSPLVSGAN